MNSIASPMPPHALPRQAQRGTEYLSYVPDHVDRGHSPIVFVHGYSRQVHQQIAVLRRLADATHRALIAPCFTKTLHPRYQRLGKGNDGQRADHYFDACLTAAGQELGISTQRVILMGYSGGAQFCHRWTMTRPERVEHLIAVAAGWYTFPNPDLAFPYGIATAGRLRRVSLDPESFLAVPTTVLVGGDDRDSVNLRRNPRLDAQQGDTRVERARRWVLAMRMAARLYRVDANIAYQEVPGIDHDFHNFVERGHLLELVLAAILETPRSEDGDGSGVNNRAA